MKRRVFYSFHYQADHWRAQQVRNIGAVEGQKLAHANEWEKIKRAPDGIKRWIDDQLVGKSCVIVLIGTETYTRPWVLYEICRGWNERKGVLGIHIHRLEDSYGRASLKGMNPFEQIRLENGRLLSEYAPVFDPPGYTSRDVYRNIQFLCSAWIDFAIRQRLTSFRAA